MLTQRDYCDYDTCVALDELGCPITKWISGDVVSTFTLYEAQKWLREEKDLYIEVTIVVSGKNYMFEIYNTETAMLKRFVEEDYSTYEEALLEGIKEAIKLLKEEK